MKYTFDNVTRIVLTVISIVGIILLVRYLQNALLPFLFGWLIAYLLYPLVRFIQYNMGVKRRGLSIALAMIISIALSIGVIYAVAPIVVREVNDASIQITEYTNKLNSEKELPASVVSFFENISEKVDFRQIFNPENIEKMSQKVLPQVWNLLSNTWQIFAAIFIVFIVLLYIIFILLDYEAITNGFTKLIPQRYKSFVVELIEDVELGMNRYFRGQVLIATIVGIMFAVGFKLIGLPLGLTIGILIGILNIVPYMQTIGLIPIPLLAMLQCVETGQNYWVVLGLCILVFIFVQTTQDLVLVPKIMGKAMGLNPAIILLSLSIWGTLMGLAGMIIALPFTTILVAYYKRYVLHQKAKPFEEDITDSILEQQNK